VEQPQWYGELWIKYPLGQSRLPTYHGLVFKAQADFWTIITEFLLLTFSRPRSIARLSLAQIFGFYNRLQAWLHNLPEPLTPRKIVLPHQLKLHMHYQSMLVDIFTPILEDTEADKMLRLGKTPRDIYIEALTHLETLMRLYYLRHGFEGFDSFLIHFLGTLNYMTMTGIESEADPAYREFRRSTMILLLKGIHDQGQAHFVARAVLRLQASYMRREDVELLKRYVEINEGHLIYGPLEQAFCSDWPTYGIGLEAKAERLRQGISLSSTMASLCLGPSTSPT
jgi:hypothetical protein